jgi:hypothetical protein
MTTVSVLVGKFAPESSCTSFRMRTVPCLSRICAVLAVS